MDSDTSRVRSSRQLSARPGASVLVLQHQRCSMSHSSRRKCRPDGGGRHSPVFTLTKSRRGVTFTGNVEDSILLYSDLSKQEEIRLVEPEMG